MPPRSIGDKTMAGLADWSARLGLSMVGALALLAGEPAYDGPLSAAAPGALCRSGPAVADPVLSHGCVLDRRP